MKRLLTCGLLVASTGLAVCTLEAKFHKAVLKEKGKRGNPFRNLYPKRVNRFFRQFFDDTYDIGANIFRETTLKIITATIPFYLVARQFDNKIHNFFYDAQTHTNKHQPPSWLVDVGYKYLPVPMVLFGSLGFLDDDPYIRRRSRIFAVGTAWAFVLKYICKDLIKTDATLRPLNGNFDKNKRVHGGSPSGHMAMLAYFSTFWSLEFKSWWVVPLTAYSFLGASMCIAANKHYLSQTIVGSGIGIVLGFGAHALVDSLKLPESLSCAITSNPNGALGVSLAYDF